MANSRQPFEVPPRVRNLAWLLPLGIFLLNFVLKLLFLDTVQLSLDEPFTVFHAQMPAHELIEALRQYNNPPLFELLLSPWIDLFGISEFAVRFPSLLFSSLTAVFIFFLGNEIDRTRTGLIAALIYTFATEHIYFAHEARAYALWTLLSTASLYLLLRYVRDHRNLLWAGALVLCNALLIYTHYFGFITLFVETAWLLLWPRRDKVQILLRFGATLAICALLYIPQVLTVLDRMGRAAGEHWVDTANLDSLYNVLAKYTNQPVPTVIFLALLVAATVLVVRNRQWRAGRPATYLLLGLWPVAFLGMFLLGLFFPVFLDRYLVFAMPAYYLLVARAVFYVFDPIRGAIGSLLLVAVMVFSVHLAPDKQSQWKEIAAYIGEEKTLGTQVLIAPKWNYRAFSYFYDREAFADYPNTEARLAREGIQGVLPYINAGRLDLAGKDRLLTIVVGDFQAQFHPSVSAVIAEKFRQVAVKEDFHGIRIVTYQAKE